MRIESLSLTNFRRFTHFEMPFHPSLNVLVARNGAGKTSILDGVAICLGALLTHLPEIKGISFKKSDLHLDTKGTKAPYMRLACCLADHEITSPVCWDRTELRDKAKKTTREVPRGLGLKQLHAYADRLINAYNDKQPLSFPVILYYGAGRGVFDIPARKRNFGKTFTRFQAFEDCLESRTHFRRFVEYFYALEDRELKEQKARNTFDFDLPELKALRMAVNRGLPEMANPRGVEPAGILVDWTRDGHTYPLRIDQLSDGYRTTLAMIMDIAARMAEANPHLEDALETHGVVLIDEVDLHLHPGWQQTILADLQRAFPNVQFIVSTHSPQVLTAVPPECIRLIDWQDDTPILKAVQFSEGAEAQQVLEDILGIQARPGHLDIVQKLHKYQELVNQDQWETDTGHKLLAELEAWGGEFEPELRRLEIDKRLKTLDRP